MKYEINTYILNDKKNQKDKKKVTIKVSISEVVAECDRWISSPPPVSWSLSVNIDDVLM